VHEAERVSGFERRAVEPAIGVRAVPAPVAA
jgi:hypothetical protein